MSEKPKSTAQTCACETDMIFTVPPAQWEHFLPLGNGRLGAMVKAHPCNEVLQLNEEGIWSGGPMERANTDAKKFLPRIRSLVKSGNVLEAQELAFHALSGTSPNERAYQTAGEVHVDFFSPAHTGLECGFPLCHTFSPACLDSYRAVLSLETAAVTVTYTDENGVTFTRKTWASAEDDMIFMHVTADKAGAVNFSLYVERGIWVDSVFARDNFVFLQDSHGVPFCLGVGAVGDGGTIETKGAMLTGESCNGVLFFIDIRSLQGLGGGIGKPNAKRVGSITKREYDTAAQKNTRNATLYKTVYQNLLRYRESVLCGGDGESKTVRPTPNTEQDLTPNGESFLQTKADSLFARHVTEYRSHWNTMSVHIGHDTETNTHAATDTSARGGNNGEPVIATGAHTTAKEVNTDKNARGLYSGSAAATVSDSEPAPHRAPIQQPVSALLDAISPENTALINLYASFSRYLLIAGSRSPGSLPLTLQGLWNTHIDPPWGSKYTININTQMNYWPVSMASLSSMETPLFALLERAYQNGVHVARTMYGCRGFVMHHNTDCWGDCAPQDYWIPGTYWFLGAPWLATHIWEHYEYTQNAAELERYYYLLHESCLFFVDFLQETNTLAADGKPYLVINPSVSPENSYVTQTGQVGAFCEGCQMDNMILREAFTDCLKAAAVLGARAVTNKGKRYGAKDFTDFAYVLAHLKEPTLNKDGSLTEWNREVSEVEPGHRHISHLYGLFPGHSIDTENAVLKNAAIKTLQNRLQHGGGHTGWSEAWIINFWVTLGKSEEALDGLLKILKNSTLPNLLDNHPPFQIDGNFGTLAGICRMLVQSRLTPNGEIRVKLLPCLPREAAWQNGRVRGLGIKGGYSVSFDWENGKATNVSFVPNEYANKNAKITVE